MILLGNVDLEKIVLPFYKLILAYGQLIIIPQQQVRLSESDEDNGDGNDNDEGNDEGNDDNKDESGYKRKILVSKEVFHRTMLPMSR